MKMAVFHFCILIIFSFLLSGEATEDCNPTSCSKECPIIQFPFRHKHLHGQECGYPGFDLYCNNRETLLKLPVSVEVSVKEIDSASQKLKFYDPGRCLLQKLQYLNLSASPFHFPVRDLMNYTLFNCSENIRRNLDGLVACLGGPGYQVYAVNSNRFSAFFVDPYSYSFSLSSCTRIHEILSVPQNILFETDLQLEWYEPACGKCEAQGKLCRYDNTTRENQIECANKSKTNNGPSRRPLIAGACPITSCNSSCHLLRYNTTCVTITFYTGAIGGSFILITPLGALCYLYYSVRANKENQLKIKKFLEDYEALKPARFTYADIRRITNHFDEKLGEGGYGTVYKGKLSDEVYVAVKVLNNTKGNGEEFINEVRIIGRIHHINVVRLVGFCAEGITRALVYEFLQNGSLEKFIFQEGSERIPVEKLEDIAIGIARGIEYLHHGCDQQILHFDIKPQNILLDHDFNAKISDFGLAKLCSKEQSGVSITSGRGTMGYIAPEVLSRAFGRVSNKSDIYSFGMVLLEMVKGGKYEDLDMNSKQDDFPQWIYNHVNQKENTEQIMQSDEYKIMRKLTVVGLWCIQWSPADRRPMEEVVQMLEGDGDNLTMPSNPFPGTNPAKPHGRRYQTERASDISVTFTDGVF